MEILKLKEVIKYYGHESVVTKAIDGISLSINKSEFVAIMGASGSGKTTLLNLVATIDTVSSGHIFIDNMDITCLKEKLLAQFRRDKLGFIFQDYNLLDTLTIYENIILPLTLKNISETEIKVKVEEMIKIFQIEGILGKFPYEVSGGERQRAACARALITNPKLILADEPTGALDSRNSKTLMKLLEMMNSTYGATILTVTHDAVVASYASRVLFLKDGRLYNEILKGEKSREKFYKEIVDINTMTGGEQYVR